MTPDTHAEPKECDEHRWHVMETGEGWNSKKGTMDKEVTFICDRCGKTKKVMEQ